MSRRIGLEDCLIAEWKARAEPELSGTRWPPFEGDPGVRKSSLMRSTPLKQ